MKIDTWIDPAGLPPGGGFGRGRFPVVSLRSTTGYGLRSLRDEGERTNVPVPPYMPVPRLLPLQTLQPPVAVAQRLDLGPDEVEHRQV